MPSPPSQNLPGKSAALKQALVVTSIAGPDHPVLKRIASSAEERGVPFILIGDVNSPPDRFSLPGVEFYGHNDPRLKDLTYEKYCPTSNYSRKNLGYLLAARLGVEWIVETDDDNDPSELFWETPEEKVTGRVPLGKGWVNAYSAFSDKFIYPRGFPLDEARNPVVFSEPRTQVSPVQQRLVDGDPDVDAIYRLLFDLPFQFEQELPLLVGEEQWCPFNSQNTVFFKRAFPLLYLPTFCSFRMTDIWRSFVAQRVLQSNNYCLSYHSPNAIQYRNKHNLMGDFAQEVPGYLENKKIVEFLSSLTLPSGDDQMPEAVYACYEAMVRGSWLPSKELVLLSSWMDNLKTFLKP